MKRIRKVRGSLVALLFLAIGAVAGCGEDALSPAEGIEPFVGDWRATGLEVRSAANEDLVVDLIEMGAAFTINVQPSGQYTAILIFAQQASTEIGQLTVSGNTLTMARAFPTPATTTAQYVFSGSGLTLDGATEFDFNLDGVPDAAFAHFELVREP